MLTPHDRTERDRIINCMIDACQGMLVSVNRELTLYDSCQPFSFGRIGAFKDGFFGVAKAAQLAFGIQQKDWIEIVFTQRLSKWAVPEIERARLKQFMLEGFLSAT